VAAAGRRCVLALLEATAVGPGTFLAAAGSAALAAAAREAHRPVWLVAGVGRVLPGPLYEALVRRVGDDPAYEVVPLDLVDDIVGPTGPVPRARLARPSVPVAAELLRFSG
jgi:translation initiation factor 2B subunit (eIF-2B alpha/beta/delta family)